MVVRRYTRHWILSTYVQSSTMTGSAWLQSAYKRSQATYTFKHFNNYHNELLLLHCYSLL